MLAIVRKTRSDGLKEFQVCSAEGSVIALDGQEREYLQEKEVMGQLCLNCQSRGVTEGSIKVPECESRVVFEEIKPEKWNGRVGRIKTGHCLNADGSERYLLSEKLHEKGSFWIFKSGYIYYEMLDRECGKRYVIKDITFGSDMHYYYIYDERDALIAAIYKPYRKQGADEYHLYTKNEEILRGLLFMVVYIDYFYYPYDTGSAIDMDNYSFYDDDAAYHISDDELLALYDENFTKSVILNT